MRLIDALLEIVRGEGVRRIFGDPGTTELPLIDALAGVPDLSYVLGLQEASVVAMADGHARATGRPSFVNLHVAGGVANGLIGMLDGIDTLFLEKVSGRRSMPIISRVGGRLPAYCTATGKLFLAFGAPERLRRVLRAGLARYTPHTITMPGLLVRDPAVDQDDTGRSCRRASRASSSVATSSGAS
ncbi:thiamine pyrophosphate-binding protein [Actinoallomurus sp. NBC_01490]|uniref:thiamine pyrophosphate-binding protein n=1 Tax=Actinoallomurus sp. NBC_01490 TaxID=2903557 RepID=UPI002E36E59F|nr:thiamine pyrophosphate-binding protein [Actinoallomurus sp. NBC_01490]